MNSRSLARALAPSIFFALLLAVLSLASAARAASAGDFAPENLEKTDAFFNKICFIRPLCPVAPHERDIIKRALLGDRSAEYLLGLTLLTGDGLPGDRDAGIAWVARAAEHGEPAAARDIAGRLRNGANVTVDETKIADALRPQAEAGDVEAMRSLGPMMIRGRGTKQDPAAGLAMIRTAAEKGSSGAEKDLSQLYLDGAPGVPVNRPEAMKWLGVSAQHGNVDAMLSLGYMSIGGAQDIRNLVTGYCWLMRAALLDHPQAHEKLSTIFAEGEKDGRGTVITVDLVQADYWFRLAARSPFHDNSQIRSMIEPKMTTAQIDEAKKLVDGWQKRTVEELRSTVISMPGSSRTCPAMT
jgi:hypothetical protein